MSLSHITEIHNDKAHAINKPWKKHVTILCYMLEGMVAIGTNHFDETISVKKDMPRRNSMPTIFEMEAMVSLFQFDSVSNHEFDFKTSGCNTMVNSNKSYWSRDQVGKKSFVVRRLTVGPTSHHVTCLGFEPRIS